MKSKGKISQKVNKLLENKTKKDPIKNIQLS